MNQREYTLYQQLQWSKSTIAYTNTNKTSSMQLHIYNEQKLLQCVLRALNDQKAVCILKTKV